MTPPKLSLRLRTFLFFALMAALAAAITAAALWAGFTRVSSAGVPSGFVTAGLIAGFGLTGLCAAIWRLFDANIALPVERLAAGLRARAQTGAAAGLDRSEARHLGDLAPAAEGLADRLRTASEDTEQEIAAKTTQLKAERDRLADLLSDIPLAMIIATPDHRIAMYDRQAAAALSQAAPPRLMAPLAEYLDPAPLTAAHAQLGAPGGEIPCTAEGHGGAVTFSLRLMPLTGAPGYLIIIDGAESGIPPEAARPLVYDLALMDGAVPGGDARALTALPYVVFDTETTGLLPHKDAVVQIGALRMLGPKPVPGEVFDTLVDPGRPIPPASTRVHGVSDAMVAGAPNFTTAGKSFHQFASGAVLVAHNAPFDMAFLRRHAARTGVHWDHPILDTVLLSAVLFGTTEVHTLDALCERLGVLLPPEDRHTALGDARATAAALSAMLPMLQARGLTTLDAVIAETRKHGRLLEDLN